ncbi:AraC family transcriptional regulator [Lutibacter sp. B1]|uniref:helix-turn-helix domain-containing protein n=1 Tax=Lutibacter sp. B1 TaxID=2725996 RepID=UPI001457166B|nr:AraC family transcriptional regulator [Lutibacter sp. B1]NLP57456.1 helix-turn-helix transcriptional regulator [Lutibacter sp. B1]
MTNTFYIKNMVCPRCIESVGEVFSDLNIEISTIELGKVTTITEVGDAKKKQLGEKLTSRGFELLQDKNSKIISQIKAIIIEQIHYKSEELNVNFSTLLSDKLHHDYSSLSKLFSSVESITIERFIIKQKIEHVKELLFYKQLTLSEIAFQIGYSSVAHLSSQFKKETGMSPTEFKKLRNPNLKSLDSI